MGCPSPAARLVEQAREAELEVLPTHAGDDVELLMRAAGAPRSWLDDYLDTSSEASSDSGEASCSDVPLHGLSGALNSAVKAEVRQQQQVTQWLQHAYCRLTSRSLCRSVYLHRR